MSTENPVADRLLNDARKKAARQDSRTLGVVAIVVGAIALVSNLLWIVLGWVLGATAIGLGAAALRRPASAKQGKIAMFIGLGAILVGIFILSWAIALRR